MTAEKDAEIVEKMWEKWVAAKYKGSSHEEVVKKAMKECIRLAREAERQNARSLFHESHSNCHACPNVKCNDCCPYLELINKARQQALQEAKEIKNDIEAKVMSMIGEVEGEGQEELAEIIIRYGKSFDKAIDEAMRK